MSLIERQISLSLPLKVIDAAYINRIAPTAMIFVPSISGRSHVEVENTEWKDCEAGANVLLHCILQSSNEL